MSFVAMTDGICFEELGLRSTHHLNVLYIDHVDVHHTYILGLKSVLILMPVYVKIIGDLLGMDGMLKVHDSIPGSNNSVCIPYTFSAPWESYNPSWAYLAIIGCWGNRGIFQRKSLAEKD